MRIAVNALYLLPGGVGGTEIYLRSLLNALAQLDRGNEYLLLTNRETSRDLVPPLAPNFRFCPQPVAATNRPARILYEQFRLTRRNQFDVLFNPGFTAPLFTRKPQVTVFHDLQHQRHPEHFRWFDLPAWQFLLWGAVQRSTRLISVSKATHDDLLQYYNAESTVVPHGVDERFFDIGRRRKQTATEPILLCVSTLHPHKNHERLLNVFARLRTEFPQWRLILTGLRGFHAEPIERRIAQLNIGDSVELTGWISRDNLYDLYRRARAFVYPSTFEGFGMPVLEALAANVPTACSNIEPLRSIAGRAALQFDPLNEDDMYQVLRRLLSGEVAPQPAPARAGHFSWATAAAQTLAVIEEAARPKRAGKKVLEFPGKKGSRDAS